MGRSRDCSIVWSVFPVLPPSPSYQPSALPQARRSPQKFQGGKWAPLKVPHKAGKGAALQMRFCPRSPRSWAPVLSPQHNFSFLALLVLPPSTLGQRGEASWRRGIEVGVKRW